MYTTNVNVTLPETITIPNWGEFELPDWLAGKEIEITDVTWKEKAKTVDSSFDLYIDYQINAPKTLFNDIGTVLIYDLDLDLSIEQIKKLIEGDYSDIIDQLKNPTVTKAALSEKQGMWTRTINMEDRCIFNDTYVMVGTYVDLDNQKIYRDAEIVTFQAINTENKKTQTQTETQEKNKNNNPIKKIFKIKPFNNPIKNTFFTQKQFTLPNTIFKNNQNTPSNFFQNFQQENNVLNIIKR